MTDSTEREETSRDRQRDATRQRLHDAAITIFKRDGFRAARVDDITLVAGVSRTAFYFHFPDKEDVLLAHLRQREDRITQAIAELAPGTKLPQLTETLVAAMAKEWEEDRGLLLDALTVTLRRQAAGVVLERPLLAELERRFGNATTAEQCLLALTSAATAYEPSPDRSFADALRTAGKGFVEGVKG